MSATSLVRDDEFVSESFSTVDVTGGKFNITGDVNGYVGTVLMTEFVTIIKRYVNSRDPSPLTICKAIIVFTLFGLSHSIFEITELHISDVVVVVTSLSNLTQMLTLIVFHVSVFVCSV